MKVRALVAGLLVAAVSVSAAVAAPPPGKGKPETTPSGAPGKPLTTGQGCRPQVTVVLRGAITSLGTSLGMSVTGSNRWGRAWKTAGTASVTVSSDTKVRRNGKKTATDLASGDWVLVQARVCKEELAGGAMPPLVAVRVVAHPARA